MEVKLNPLQRLILKLWGKVYIGHRQPFGWKTALPFYAFRCEELYPDGSSHGLQVGPPSGYSNKLVCPICQRPAKQ